MKVEELINILKELQQENIEFYLDSKVPYKLIIDEIDNDSKDKIIITFKKA